MCCLVILKEKLDYNKGRLPEELNELLTRHSTLHPCSVCGQLIFGSGSVVEMQHMRLPLLFYTQQDIMFKADYCSLYCRQKHKKDFAIN